MFTLQKGTKIEKLEFDQRVYRIRFNDIPMWTVYVFREDGAVSFLKGSILPESVDRFEARRNGKNTEIYLHTKGAVDGPRAYYSGETDNHAAATAWVSVVNKIYENRRNNPKLANVAD
ncbi:hypothetical protein H8E77_08185 [bacterium]|nr:hypothetical protein [bacterium]